MDRIPAGTRVLAVLPDLVDALSQHASASTVRQRQWAINQALEHYVHTTGGRIDINSMTRVRLEELLSPAAIGAYLQAATEGQLRLRAPGPEKPRPESSRTTAARSAALRWLARHTDLTGPPALAQDKGLIDPSKQLADDLRQAISIWSNTGEPVLLRAAAAAAAVASTASPTTELVQLTVDQVDNQSAFITLPALLLEPLPESFEVLDGRTARARMHPWAVAPFRAWLRHRRTIVARLEGADPKALFVTCHPNRRHEPPGMPLSVRGLTAAHAQAIRKLADHQPDLNPPKTLAIVRRVALARLLGTI